MAIVSWGKRRVLATILVASVALVLLAAVGVVVAGTLLRPRKIPPFELVNDTASPVLVSRCSQDKAPAPFEISPGSRLQFRNAWLTPDDEGYACYLHIGDRSLGACLIMPTGGRTDFSYRASAADPGTSEKDCMALTAPHL
ncbi:MULTISPECIES: hypothetical protein [Arthrobacter]|uniref:Uncharacterized protein n=2 Tax=Arthrobacter TaxID=1663 RepID=A0ABU9KFS7_9MICC|nr:hypothetical protein [Arthrobacter sp. YJM1]MDP5225724.1 hypothetical protein [Arthrobacter sp. YJM1]